MLKKLLDKSCENCGLFLSLSQAVSLWFTNTRGFLNYNAKDLFQLCFPLASKAAYMYFSESGLRTFPSITGRHWLVYWGPWMRLVLTFEIYVTPKIHQNAVDCPNIWYFLNRINSLADGSGTDLLVYKNLSQSDWIVCF